MGGGVKEVPKHRRAPDGHIWQCPHCGKRAEERYGIVGRRDRGYDESCALNAVPTPGNMGGSNA
jgi:hypothetical protein